MKALKCKRCGKEFEQRSLHQVYCHVNCRTADYRDRQKKTSK